MTLSLVADQHEWLIMHQECARQCDPPNQHRGTYWYVADLTNPVSGILNDPCAWCQRRLSDHADPKLIPQGVPEGKPA